MPESVEVKLFSVFYPKRPQAAMNLENATLFTRINVLVTQHELIATLNSTPSVQNTFCLIHLSDILVFDANKEEHTNHVMTVLQLLDERNMEADICAFNKPSWKEAGLSIEAVGGETKKAFIVKSPEILEYETLAA